MLDISLLDRDTLRLVYIFVLAVSIWVVFQLLTSSIVRGISSGSPRGRRLRTLSSVVRTAGSTFIVGFAIFESLATVGVNITPLLASAGVVGLAIGFGAQTLVKDIITGFFLLVEDQFDEGDEIEIAGKKGTVLKITLRTIWLKESGGTLHIVPAGSITSVSNFTRFAVKEQTSSPKKKKK
jgi:small conductance mechanosensitive channel